MHPPPHFSHASKEHPSSSCLWTPLLALWNILLNQEVWANAGLVYYGRWPNINNGIKEPTCRYQICNTTQILIFGGCLKVREIFVHPSYYLGQYHSKPCWYWEILHGDECSCMVYRPKWYRKQWYHQTPICNKRRGIIIIDTQNGTIKKMIPNQHWCGHKEF